MLPYRISVTENRKVKMIWSGHGRWIGVVPAGVVALLLQGCATSGAPPLGAVEAQQGLRTYRLGAGDKLRISVYN